MRTGYRNDGQTDYPALGALLAKELGNRKSDVPYYVAIAPPENELRFLGPGFLGPEFAPLVVAGESLSDGASGKDERQQVEKFLPLEAFQKIRKDQAEAMRKATLRALDLSEERKLIRDVYGRNLFGQGCLAARRLIERGASVVEVTLPGWDTHANNFELVQRQSEKLDAAWASLLTDLEDHQLLDNTLIVWMGEFGRTPRINAANGRDHWPRGFTVVLAGGGIKGGQVIGKTSPDGMTIEERPVTPPELLATIFQALNLDPTKENKSNLNTPVSLVEKGTKPVKEVLK
jgi:hypothetical protein